jgi:GT2 family glycosyltransferase
MPTLLQPHAQAAFDSLQYLPFPYTLHTITDKGKWPDLINIGLKRSTMGNDILIMDDDVRVHPDTFKRFAEYYDKADIFGFKLLFADGTIQHGGGIYLGDGCITHRFHRQHDREMQPAYVCHVTASLMYIKDEVIQDLRRMEKFSGEQFEDVDWNWRAIKRGFKVMFLPDAATHLESGTKGSNPTFQAEMHKSLRELLLKHFEHDLAFEGRMEREFPIDLQPI